MLDCFLRSLFLLSLLLVMYDLRLFCAAVANSWFMFLIYRAFQNCILFLTLQLFLDFILLCLHVILIYLNMLLYMLSKKGCQL